MWGAIAALVAFLGWTGAVWYYSGEYHVEAEAKARQKAEEKVQELKDELTAQANQGVLDKQKAYADGQAAGKTIVQTVQARGASDVARYPVFQNPACVLPPESLALLNSARGSLRSNRLAPVQVQTAPLPAAPAVVPTPIPPVPPAATSPTGFDHPKPRPKK